MFRGVMARQGLGVGGSLAHRCCYQLPSCSAPSLFGRPAWCCRPIQRQIAGSSATCANVPFRFRLCISSVGASGSPGGTPRIPSLLQTSMSSRGHMFLRLTNVDAVLYQMALHRLVCHGLPVRGTRGAVARRHSWDQVFEDDLPPPPGVLTAERPVPNDTSQARPGRARPRGAACRLTSRWSSTKSLLHMTRGHTAWTGSEKDLELGFACESRWVLLVCLVDRVYGSYWAPAHCGKNGPWPRCSHGNVVERRWPPQQKACSNCGNADLATPGRRVCSTVSPDATSFEGGGWVSIDYLLEGKKPAGCVVQCTRGKQAFFGVPTYY